MVSNNFVLPVRKINTLRVVPLLPYRLKLYVTTTNKHLSLRSKIQTYTVNYYCIFGTLPTQGVPAKSLVAKSFVEMTKKWLEEHGGVLVMPDIARKIKKYIPAAEFRDNVTQDLVYDVNLANE